MEHFVDRDPRRVLAECVFPKEASLRDKLRYLLNYAVLAPSSHNSQPWHFDFEEDAISLYADRTRALPVVDPTDRELIMSCGAALFTLRVALLRYGLVPRVHILPKPLRPNLLARVDIESRGEPDLEMLPLFDAIRRRHTNRGPFEDRAVPVEIVDRLSQAAERENAPARFVTTAQQKEEFAALVAAADRIQAADPAFRDELARWIRPNGPDVTDGMPGYTVGMEGVTSYAGPLLVRTFDWGDRQAARDQQVAEGSPLLMALWTHGDDAAAWLDAGQALARVLLTATAEGLAASFLNQPVEVPSIRETLRHMLVVQRHPQTVIRLGFGPPVRSTPRRPVAEVLWKGVR